MSITVIIPCYNSAPFIENTLSYLAAQSHSDLQIICVNDGSTDNTLDVLNDWRRKDSRLEIIDKPNGGIESALKAAVPKISKLHVFLHGHDDWLDQDALHKLYSKINSNLTYDAVRVKLKLVYPNGEFEFFKDHIVEDLPGLEALKNTILSWKTHTFCLWKAPLFKRIIEVDTGGLMNFDELATRFLYSQSNMVTKTDAIYNYLQHEQSVTKRLSKRLLDEYTIHYYIKNLLISLNIYDQYRKKYELFLQNNLQSFKQRCKALKDNGFSLNKSDILKFKLTFEALDKNYLQYGNNFLDNIKCKVLYSSFWIYYFNEKLKKNI